jgi:hypothetical protein
MKNLKRSTFALSILIALFFSAEVLSFGTLPFRYPEKLEDARERLGTPYPEMSSLLTYTPEEPTATEPYWLDFVQANSEADAKARAVREIYYAEVAAGLREPVVGLVPIPLPPIEPVDEPVEPVAVWPYAAEKTQLYGLLTQLENLINNSNDSAAAMRSMADLYTKKNEVLIEIQALREILSDTN